MNFVDNLDIFILRLLGKDATSFGYNVFKSEGDFI